MCRIRRGATDRVRDHRQREGRIALLLARFCLAYLWYCFVSIFLESLMEFTDRTTFLITYNVIHIFVQRSD